MVTHLIEHITVKLFILEVLQMKAEKRVLAKILGVSLVMSIMATTLTSVVSASTTQYGYRTGTYNGTSVYIYETNPSTQSISVGVRLNNAKTTLAKMSILGVASDKVRAKINGKKPVVNLLTIDCKS